MRGFAHILAAVGLSAMAMVSCQDESSVIGGSLAGDNVNIVVDSLATDLHGTTEWVESFDSRTTTKLLGRITVPEYGSLNCTFVTQLMSATKMNVPDSITAGAVDSVRMILSIPRGGLTGDSLAPQQLKVYELTKQLPSDISSRFNATGYYDPAKPMGTRSYTISNIAMGDSAFKQARYVRIPVKLPKEFGDQLFAKYRADDPMFQWPATFNQWFPGIYVEQNFGNGCIGNITGVETYLYWHRQAKKTSYKDSVAVTETVIVRDSICLLASKPEVLSSNNIDYKPGDRLKAIVESGKQVITSPGGYELKIRFPLKSLVERFMASGSELSIVSSLSMSIPAKAITNDYGIGTAPYLLMIRSDEKDEFFAQNKVPDNKTSFTAAYDSANGQYRFAGLRSYFVDVINDLRSGKTVTVEDVDFTLLPVMITTETEPSYYGDETVYVTRVAPYLAAPTMTELDTEKSTIVFTFSTQTVD